MSGNDTSGMGPWWLPLTAYALVVVGLLNHLMFVTGAARERFSRWYFDPAAPRIVRNLGFAQLPAAVTFAVAGIPMIVLAVTDPLPAPVALVGVAGFFAGLLWTFKEVMRPSERRKPRWLVEEESRRGWTADAESRREKPSDVGSGVDVYRWRNVYVVDPWRRGGEGMIGAGTVRCLPLTSDSATIGAAVVQALDPAARESGPAGVDRYAEVLAATGLPSWERFLRRASVVHISRDVDGAVLVGPAASRGSGARSGRSGPRYRAPIEDLDDFGHQIETSLLPGI